MVIRWQLFVEAKTPDKAQRVLARFARALGKELAEVDCAPYWKDPALFRANVSSPVCSTGPALAVNEALHDCSSVAHKWIVGAPQCYEGDQWEFTGSAVSQTIRVPGVTSIEFQVGDLPRTSPSASLQREPDRSV